MSTVTKAMMRSMDREAAMARKSYIESLRYLKEQTERAMEQAERGEVHCFNLNVQNMAGDVIRKYAALQHAQDMLMRFSVWGRQLTSADEELAPEAARYEGPVRGGRS